MHRMILNNEVARAILRYKRKCGNSNNISFSKISALFWEFSFVVTVDIIKMLVILTKIIDTI